MTKAKTKRKRTKARHRKRRVVPAHRDHSTVAIGQKVHRGKGKKREDGVIIGWSRTGKRQRLTWIIGPTA